MKNILWLLHHPWKTIEGQREHFLIQRLKEKVNIHVLTWSYNEGRSRFNFLNPLYYAKTLRSYTNTVDKVHVHHFPVFPNIPNFLATNKMQSFFINRQTYQHAISKIVKKHQIEKVICGTNHWNFGHPPQLNIEVIFDYLDHYPDQLVKEISQQCEHALCVSHYLEDQAKKHFQRTTYSPNGIDLNRFANIPNKEQAKQQLQISDRFVVSLIGLTCSPTLYFVDALRKFQDQEPNLTFLFVGGGEMARMIEQRCLDLNVNFVNTGRIPHEQIQTYFSATDVGLYPGDCTEVYDGACPLKVLEYTATGTPVVSSPSKELENLAFENVILSDIDIDSFATNLLKAKDLQFTQPEMANWSWDQISENLLKIINE